MHQAHSSLNEALLIVKLTCVGWTFDELTQYRSSKKYWKTKKNVFCPGPLLFIVFQFPLKWLSPLLLFVLVSFN